MCLTGCFYALRGLLGKKNFKGQIKLQKSAEIGKFVILRSMCRYSEEVFQLFFIETIFSHKRQRGGLTVKVKVRAGLKICHHHLPETSVQWIFWSPGTMKKVKMKKERFGKYMWSETCGESWNFGDHFYQIKASMTFQTFQLSTCEIYALWWINYKKDRRKWPSGEFWRGEKTHPVVWNGKVCLCYWVKRSIKLCSVSWESREGCSVGRGSSLQSK